MDYITLHTMQKLKEVGFTYPAYEHNLNNGMLFYYQGDEYVIGGYSNGSCSEQDIEVAKNGIWLPEASQLLLWLEDTHFRVTITTDKENLYKVHAIDAITDSVYHGSDLTLANALAVVIRKICKSKQRAYIPEQRLSLEIVATEDAMRES